MGLLFHSICPARILQATAAYMWASDCHSAYLSASRGELHTAFNSWQQLFVFRHALRQLKLQTLCVRMRPCLNLVMRLQRSLANAVNSIPYLLVKPSYLTNSWCCHGHIHSDYGGTRGSKNFIWNEEIPICHPIVSKEAFEINNLSLNSKFAFRILP